MFGFKIYILTKYNINNLMNAALYANYNQNAVNQAV